MDVEIMYENSVLAAVLKEVMSVPIGEEPGTVLAFWVNML